MKTLLQIGEVAQLLGVTPKTIRHYQKIGLLAEPERTEAGYRLYTAQDLLRLQRIKRLQTFGLSLKQIQAVLGDVKQEQTLREVLQSLDKELTIEIGELEERRQKIQALLSEDTPEAFSSALNTSPSTKFVQKHLGDALAQVSPELWEQEMQAYSYLDSFHWAKDHEEKMQHFTQQFVEYYVEHPEEYQQVLAFAERFVAISSYPQDAIEVKQLVEDIVHHYAEYPFMLQLQESLQEDNTHKEGPFTKVFWDLLQSVYSPTQEWVLQEVGRLLMEHLKKGNNT